MIYSIYRSRTVSAILQEAPDVLWDYLEDFIREELELIKKFCWQPKLAAGKIYTEEKIDAVERGPV